MSKRICPVCSQPLQANNQRVHVACWDGIPDAARQRRSDIVVATTREVGQGVYLIRQPMRGVTWETLVEATT